MPACLWAIAGRECPIESISVKGPRSRRTPRSSRKQPVSHSHSTATDSGNHGIRGRRYHPPHMPPRIAPTPPAAGAYRIGELLASGGFGAVYRAEHTSSGAAAAVKIMHAELSADRGAVGRFEREIEVMQRLRHPGVLEVFDRGRLPDGRPFLAMELLAGESLRAHLDARGRLEVAEALAILEPLADALGAAHARGVIHRDLKPSNVFLAEAGRRRRVVLLDFGVAKLLDAEGPALTRSGNVVGTTSCMAPEQILTRPIDVRSDVYALGVLAYRMLAGEPPFAARNLIALQQAHLYMTPRPPSAAGSPDPALDAPILRALAKEPPARQPSAAAFLSELLGAAGR
jgi:serine/threonine protein kinase